jgi:integrase
MARYQRGWLRVVERKQGRMWQLRYNTVDPANGKKKEQTTIVGSLASFPTESACWREADRQRLTEKINQPEVQTKLRCRQIADFYMNHTVFGELAHTTQYLHKHVINDYLVARWADEFALELRGLAVEEWLHSLSKDEGGELEGPTLGKLKQVMIVILRHAEKYGHLPTGFATELGKQISISTSSDYEAVILTPEQTMTILSYMRQPERTLTLLIAATGLRWSEIAGLQWQDIDWAGSRIHPRRTFIDGKTTERLKTKKSKSAVAMAPLLARFLKEWQRETLYAAPTNWVFASNKEKGRIPRAGNMLVSDYLRPAAIKAGVLRVAEDGTVYDARGSSVKRFGFHNLRHSLSTTLLTEEREDLRTVQDMMRHSTSSTTLDLYTQSSMQQRIAAQEKLLSRIVPQSELVN